MLTTQHMEHTNILCERMTGLLHVTVDNTYSYRWALNSSWDLGRNEINAVLFLLIVVVVVVVINAEQFHSWGL